MRPGLVVLALAFVSLAGAVHAQESPSEVTDGEIAKYKKAAFEGCREPGLAKGDPEERINASCACVISNLEKTMKRPEWQQLYYYWIRKDDDQQKAVLAQHVQDLGHCFKP